jgi:hypothetical protein
MTIRAALDEATATLRAAGVDTPRVDAEWLLADLLPGGRASPRATAASCTAGRRASRCS